MTVKELIEELQKFDPDQRVVVVAKMNEGNYDLLDAEEIGQMSGDDKFKHLSGGKPLVYVGGSE